MKKNQDENSNVVIRGRKVKLIPTEIQENLFWQFSGTRRFIYNWGLERKTNAWVNDGILLSFNDLRKEILFLKDNDPEYAWLKYISCDVIKQALKDLDNAFNRYFKKTKEFGYKTYTPDKIKRSKRTGKPLTIYDRNGYPKFKRKLNCEEGFHQDCCQVKFKDDMVLISKVGWVKLAQTGIFPIGYGRTDFKLYNCKIKTDGLNWYFIAGVEYTPKYMADGFEKPHNNPVGIDLGLKDFAILSDGTKYKNINKTRKVKNLEKRKKRLQKKVSRKYEKNKDVDKYVKTKNSIKLQQKILRITKHLSGIRTNYRHEVSSEIIKREPIFVCMEDLNVVGMMRNKHLSKSISDQGWGYFRTYLTYKCDENGIPIYFADRWYPSSKTCQCCGYVNKELKLKDRIYTCPNCGKSFVLDASGNLLAASNDMLCAFQATMPLSRTNTTISCVVTNARLSKAEATKVAQMCADAYAHAISPTHTTNDGDTVFVMATGEIESMVDVVAALSVRALERAIADAARSATSAYGLKAACDL